MFCKLTFPHCMQHNITINPRLNAIRLSRFHPHRWALCEVFVIILHLGLKKRAVKVVFQYFMRRNQELEFKKSKEILPLLRFKCRPSCVFVSVCLSLCVGKPRLRSESKNGLMAGAQLKKSQKWNRIILHIYSIFLFGLKSFTVCLNLEFINF